MAPDFEYNRSAWSIVVTLRELFQAHLLSSALGRHGSDTSVTWVTRGSNGQRLWISSDSIHLTWSTAKADPNDPHFALPIPDMFINQLLDIGQRKLVDEAVNSDEIEIYCNGQEDVIVARTADGRYLAVDHPISPRFTERELPYIETPDYLHDAPVVADISCKDLSFFAEAVSTVPHHVSIREHRLPPFVTISLEDNQFSWTIDWRRQGCGRYSGAAPAVVNGSVTATFYPYNAVQILKYFEDGGDAKIFIDGPQAEFAYFVGSDWGFRIRLDREHLAKWMSDLAGALRSAGYSYAESDEGQIPDRLHFTVDGLTCIASIHPSIDADNDNVRLTYIAAHGIADGTHVYDAINALNDEMAGITVELRDGEVRVVLETPAARISDFERYLTTFAQAVRKVSAKTDFFPLFVDLQEPCTH